MGTNAISSYDARAKWRVVKISGAQRVSIRSRANERYVTSKPGYSVRVIDTTPESFGMVELGRDASAA